MADTTFPKHKVLSWPAVPIPTPDEVYAGLTDQAKEYPLSLEAQLRQTDNFKKPECLTTVRVLDLSKGMIIGNWCSSMLSELGASMQAPMASFVGAMNSLLAMFAGAVEALKVQRENA